MDQLKVSLVPAPATGREHDGYTGYLNQTPLLAAPLFKLPLGSIRPLGWLKKQTDLMLNGITGRLPEYGEFFRPENNGWLQPELENGWEEIPYWLRGFYPLSVITDDKRCRQIAIQYLDRLLSTQDHDGFFGPRYLKKLQGKNGQVICDLHPHMVIMPVFIGHYEYTGDSRVIPFLRRFFQFCAELPEDQFIPLSTTGNFGWGGKEFGSMQPFVQSIRAGQMLPHLFWYYNQTGETFVLDLARRFFQHIRPPWDEWLDHHAVNFAERFAYSGIYYQLSGLPYHLDQTEYWYQQFAATWGQMPRGIFAADERIRPDCVDPRQAFETCGMVDMAKSFYYLGRITGNPQYADRVEDIMLNHFPAAYSPDQKAVHYLTAANQPQLDRSKLHHYRNGGEGGPAFLVYSPHNRCCGHNAGMGWPWYTENLWQGTADHGLAVWLYAACQIDALAGQPGVPVRCKVDTDYPFRGKAKIAVTPEQPVHFPLYLRIPRWCQNFSVSLNGQPLEFQTQKQQYLRLERNWLPGDSLEIDMAMTTSSTTWPRNGSVTIDRGPLSYSLKIEETWNQANDVNYVRYTTDEQHPNWEVLPKTPWNYGLSAGCDWTHIAPVTAEHIADNPWTVENAPIELKVSGRLIPGWTLQDQTASELQASPIYSDTPEEQLTLIPLGCARLRISCFPVVDNGPEAREWVTAPEHIPHEQRSKNRFDMQSQVNDKKQQDL